MPHEMEAPGAHGVGEEERILDQQPDVVLRDLGGIGSGARRIAALARRHGPVASLRQCRELLVEQVPRDGEAMQHEDERRLRRAGHGDVEHEARP